MSEIVIAASVAGSVPILVAGVRWAVRSATRQAIREEVNESLDRVEARVVELCSWQASHTREHRRLVDALGRQGLDAPDGWRAGPPKGEQ